MKEQGLRLLFDILESFVTANVIDADQKDAVIELLSPTTDEAVIEEKEIIKDDKGFLSDSDEAAKKIDTRPKKAVHDNHQEDASNLMLASQRPSEISETIFSQCNNFLALRLTNPPDQNYVKRLLPDTMGNLVDRMSTLRAGESLLIGDTVVLPSVVQIDMCNPTPASTDIPYWQLWQEEWHDLDINKIKDAWGRQ